MKLRRLVDCIVLINASVVVAGLICTYRELGAMSRDVHVISFLQQLDSQYAGATPSPKRKSLNHRRRK